MSRRPVATAAIALIAAMVVVLVPGVPAAVRAAVAVAFFLVAPGLGWVRALPVDGPVEQGAVVVAVSLAVDVVVAEALVYAGLSGVGPVLAVLVGVTALGLWCTGRGQPDPSRAEDDSPLVLVDARRRTDRRPDRRR